MKIEVINIHTEIEIFSCRFTKDGTSNGYDGFYRSQHYGCNTGNRSVFLALMAGEEKTRSQMLRMRTHDIQFQTFRPHLGTKTRYQALDETMREGIKTSIEEAEKLWNKHYEASARSCSHFFWHGSCSYRKTGFSCDVRIFDIFTHFVSYY